MISAWKIKSQGAKRCNEEGKMIWYVGGVLSEDSLGKGDLKK